MLYTLLNILCFFCVHPLPILPSDDKSETIQKWIGDFNYYNDSLCNIPNKIINSDYIVYYNDDWKKESINDYLVKYEIFPIKRINYRVSYDDEILWQDFSRAGQLGYDNPYCDYNEAMKDPNMAKKFENKRKEFYSNIHPNIVQQCFQSTQQLKLIFSKFKQNGINDDEYLQIYNRYLKEREKVINVIEFEKQRIDRIIKDIRESGVGLPSENKTPKILKTRPYCYGWRIYNPA